MLNKKGDIYKKKKQWGFTEIIDTLYWYTSYTTQLCEKNGQDFLKKIIFLLGVLKVM